MIMNVKDWKIDSMTFLKISKYISFKVFGVTIHIKINSF